MTQTELINVKAARGKAREAIGRTSGRKPPHWTADAIGPSHAERKYLTEKARRSPLDFTGHRKGRIAAARLAAARAPRAPPRAAAAGSGGLPPTRLPARTRETSRSTENVSAVRAEVERE